MRRLLIVFLTTLFFASFGWSNDSLFTKGLTEMSLGNYKMAINNFQKDIEQSPNFSSYYNLGIAAGNILDWNKAKWAFEAALKYSPSNEDAQYNSKFATDQINPNLEWNHPYSWVNRLSVEFGSFTWIILMLVSTLFIGFYVFNIISRKELSPETVKWYNRFTVIAVLTLGVAFFSLYKIKEHYHTEQFAIAKQTDLDLFISPNGVKIPDKTMNGERLNIIEFNDDRDWLLIQTNDGNAFWVEKEAVYVY